MTLLPEVHEALSEAMVRRAARRRWRPSRHVGVLAVGTVLVSGTAFAAATGSGWHPTIGDDHRGHPSAARSTVPAEERAALAVLRRPQTARDRGGQVEATLRMFGRGEINGIHVDGIRVLRGDADSVTVLVPAERVGRHDKGYPSSLRRNVLCLATRDTRPRLQTFRDKKGRKRTIDMAGGVGTTCGTLDRLRTRGIRSNGVAPGAYLTTGGHAPGGNLTTGGLVPDGVATVVVRLRGRRYLSAPVKDNFYEVATGKELAPGWPVQWRDAQGRTIEHRN